MMSRARVLLLLLVALWCEAARAAPTLTRTPVRGTEDGPVQGYVADGAAVYQGIPFAAPPVGALRFRAPQPAAPWNATLEALRPRAMCAQIRTVGPIFLGSEDCLYLNVYAPADHDPARDAPLPVMVWLFGGAFVLGDGYEFGLYDGAALATQQRVVVVSPNYRVGAFGFLAHAALQAEDPDNSTGNMAMRDQRAALLWTQKNVANFGGDPTQVTLFGESAGAFSVCYHLASPLSRGLFHAAIMESGTCDSPSFFQPLADATSFGDIFANAVGCNSTTLSRDAFLRCLRALDTAALISAPPSWLSPDWPNPPAAGPPSGWVSAFAPLMPFGPCVDGSPELPALPLALIRAGQFARVPLIIGTNQNEGSIFLAALPLVIRHGVTFPLSNASVPLVLAHIFNASTVQLILQEYPAYEFSDADHRVGRIIRDFFFVCASRRVARALDQQGVPAFVYHFTYKGDWVEDPFLGVYHSSELEFVWGNQWPPLVHHFSKRDRAMSDTFQAFWGALARFGDPNGNATQPVWPRFAAPAEQNIVLDVPVAVEASYGGALCDFWDTTQETP